MTPDGMRRYARNLVATLPPITPEQADRVAVLLLTGYDTVPVLADAA